MMILPCVDCITLPICKSMVREYSSDNMPPHKQHFLHDIRQKCSLVKEWLSLHEDDNLAGIRTYHDNVRQLMQHLYKYNFLEINL